MHIDTYMLLFLYDVMEVRHLQLRLHQVSNLGAFSRGRDLYTSNSYVICTYMYVWYIHTVGTSLRLLQTPLLHLIN